MFFVSHVLFYIFHLGKQAASCSGYIHCYSRKLEFLSNLGLNNILHFFGAYQLIRLLNLPNSEPLFYVIHPLR